MRDVLLGIAASLAAVAIPAVPAAAQDWAASQFTASPASITVLKGEPARFHGDFRRDRRDRDRRHHDRRRDRGFDDGLVFFGDREWQGDTAWRANSYNDWWHERPARSFPRWVRNNEGCERVWWSGGGWRC